MPIGCNDFSFAQGLKVQEEQLKFWQGILKPEIFELVHKHAVEMNRALPTDATGYDVWRGWQINEKVHKLGLAIVNGNDRLQ